MKVPSDGPRRLGELGRRYPPKEEVFTVALRQLLRSGTSVEVPTISNVASLVSGVTR